jgi:hypothetical protein
MLGAGGKLMAAARLNKMILVACGIVPPRETQRVEVGKSPPEKKLSDTSKL